MSFGQRVDWYIDNNNDIKPALQGTPLSSPVFASGVVSGGDAVLGNQVAISAPAGKGVRQGAENVQITRSLGADFTWDGNPDCAIKAIARNYAANTTNQGAERGIDIQARNSGTNISWVNAANFNARNDSGKTADQLLGIGVRVED
jgi:hypothetical protein